jgi:[protein-PII] uridylyltransferase
LPALAVAVLEAPAMDAASNSDHRPARPPHAVAAKRGAERERLAGEIAALRGEWADDAQFRQAAVRVVAAALEEGRAEARRLLEGGGKGLACAARLSALEDDIVAAVHGFALLFNRLDEPSRAPRLAVAAVGGYGRGLLAPGSDIDLLFLAPGGRAPEAEKVIETMLYALWDLRQKVGHATRSIDDCLRQAKADMTVRTALLEARFILGERTLFDEFCERFDKEIVARTTREFVAAKLAERDARLKRTGASRYEVEPNLKEGKGGLRDLNTLFWVAKYAYRVSDSSDLV